MTGSTSANVPFDPRFSPDAVRAAYDAVADDYTSAFADDLERLPLDRAMLNALAERVPPRTRVLDAGCGPAPVGSYLRASSLAVVGADLSGRMLSAARRCCPGLPATQADLRRLPFRSSSFAGAVGFYAVQHLPRSDLCDALHEFHRLLVPGGSFLLAAHLGDGERYLDEFLGHRIEPVGGCLYQRHELHRQLAKAGFEVEIEHQRGPLAHEADTERIYLLARRR